MCVCFEDLDSAVRTVAKLRAGRPSKLGLIPGRVTMQPSDEFWGQFGLLLKHTGDRSPEDRDLNVQRTDRLDRCVYLHRVARN